VTKPRFWVRWYPPADPHLDLWRVIIGRRGTWPAYVGAGPTWQDAVRQANAAAGFIRSNP